MKREPSAGGSEIGVEENVKKAVAEVFHRNSNELSEQTNFVKDLHAKSANVLELVALLEDVFGLELSFSEVMNNDTIGGVSQYIKGRLRSK